MLKRVMHEHNKICLQNGTPTDGGQDSIPIVLVYIDAVNSIVHVEDGAFCESLQMARALYGCRTQ